ncbi:armadillo-type protein [Umbelopsis sp. AD052]|nr:armadillo-type protein [Umbelopsis sp. AD052]
MEAPADEQLYPIAVLVDELKHEDTTLRLNAIRRLSTIACALGPQRTRDELVPFLDESTDDEDEVLLALAEELGNFSTCVGGNEYAHVLLRPLETLAAVEETVVRDMAVESLCKTAELLNQQQMEDHFVPLVKRLSSGDWFTSRTSAAGLFAAGHTKLTPETVDEMRKLFARLAHDDTPMVRRAAAKSLPKLAIVLSKEQLLSDLIPLIDSLSRDEQDSVRLLVVEAVISIAEKLDPEETKTHLLPILKNMISDRSWRVRYMIAEKYIALSKAVGDEIVKSDLITSFVQILKDNEAEVRTAACSQLPGFASLIDREVVLGTFVACTKDLITDTAQQVRAMLATHISGLAPILGKEQTLENLQPLFLQLLKDESSDVRLNIIRQLEQVNNVIGIEMLSQSILPAVVELAEDKQWRVRLAIIEYIPTLARQLGPDMFDKQLGTMCMSWLADPVFSIREAAIVNLKQLIEVFGSEWATATVIPQISTMAADSNYLHRMTTLFAIATIASTLDCKLLDESVLPIVLSLANDPIPNIRFNVAKTLEALVPLLKQSDDTAEHVDNKITPVLNKLGDDTDSDVRYFTHKALLTGKQ